MSKDPMDLDRAREGAFKRVQKSLMQEVLELHQAAGLAPNGRIEVTHAEAVARLREMAAVVECVEEAEAEEWQEKRRE